MQQRKTLTEKAILGIALFLAMSGPTLANQTDKMTSTSYNAPMTGDIDEMDEEIMGEIVDEMASEQEEIGDVPTLIGSTLDLEEDIGDIFTGRLFGRKRGRKKVEANPAILALARARAMGLPLKQGMAAMLNASGGDLIFKNKGVSPYIISGGFADRIPTRAKVPVAQFVTSLNRASSQYAGTSRYQFSTASPTATFTFNAGSMVTDGGNVPYAPAVVLQVSMARQSFVTGARIQVALTANDESGTAVNAQPVTLFFNEQLQTMLLVLIPFQEVATQCMPKLINAGVGGGATVVTVTGLPTGSNTTCFLPGEDSMSWLTLKKFLGLGGGNPGIARFLAQRG